MVTETEVKCEACGGKGFTEYESGVFQVECSVCHGTGRVPGRTDNELYEEGAFLLPPGQYTRADLEEVVDDSSSGTERNNQSIGGEDTGQPTQPGKPTSSKKARKRSR